jgi:hypothetical protein
MATSNSSPLGKSFRDCYCCQLILAIVAKEWIVVWYWCLIVIQLIFIFYCFFIFPISLYLFYLHFVIIIILIILYPFSLGTVFYWD